MHTHLFSYVGRSRCKEETDRNRELPKITDIEHSTKDNRKNLCRDGRRVYSSGEVSVTFDVPPVDKHLIFGVEWLIQGKLYVDAVDSVIALSRRFLINGKIKSLEYFINGNSLDDLLKNYELEVIYQRNHDDEKESKKKEIQEYQRLIRELKKFEEWKDTVSKLNSESNVPSLIEKFQQYSRGTFDLIKHFFVELSEHEDHPDREIYYEIRSLYTPYLIIELHKELVEAAMLQNPNFYPRSIGICESSRQRD